MILDTRLGFGGHVGNVIVRTMVRHSVMACLAPTSWGLGVDLLRGTHKALVTSVAAYGLAVIGNFAYEGPLGQLEAQSANIAARKITGVSRAARPEVLHPAADVLSIRNQYIQQRASVSDRALRERNSTISVRVAGSLAARYRTRNWRVKVQEMRTLGALPARKGT